MERAKGGITTNLRRNRHTPVGDSDVIMHDDLLLCAFGGNAGNHMNAISVSIIRGVGLQSSCRVVHMGTQTRESMGAQVGKDNFTRWRVRRAIVSSAANAFSSLY